MAGVLGAAPTARNAPTGVLGAAPMKASRGVEGTFVAWAPAKEGGLMGVDGDLNMNSRLPSSGFWRLAAPTSSQAPGRLTPSHGPFFSSFHLPFCGAAQEEAA